MISNRVVIVDSRRFVALARWYLRGLLATAGSAFVSVMLILLGLGGPSSSSPILGFLRAAPGPSIALLVLLILVTVIALRIAGGVSGGNGPPSSEQGSLLQWQLTALWVTTGTTMVSVALLATLLVMLISRPTWCPSWVCLPSATRAGASSDGTLEMYPAGLQANLFVLPSGDVTTLKASQLPTGTYADTAVVPLGKGEPTDYFNADAYRVNIGIHNLRTDGFPILIEHVYLRILDLPITPSPLNVLRRGGSPVYSKEPYSVVYNGEPAGTELEAAFVPRPNGLVQLLPGEADALTLEIYALLPTTLRFTVAVTYRLTNESAHHTLTFPLKLQAVFADPSNWHVYQLSGDGQLAPVAVPTSTTRP